HWIVRDPRTDADRPARFGDMVVLLRNRTSSLPAFERAFRAAGIPYVVVGGRALWARAEVRALTALCAAIENPFDGVSLVAALKSPFFGASDADLLLWRHRHGAIAAHPGLATREEPGVVGAALSRIARWHRSRMEMPPARLLEEVLAETGAIASFGLKPDGAQRIANLLRLLDAARAGTPDAPGAVAASSGSGAPLSFRAWVAWLNERATDVREEAEGAILEENADAVRILTIHAAKGLEFPIVVLGDLAARDPNGDPQLFNRATGRLALRISARERALETANFEATREEVDRREAAENLRLLYVAATRARDSLVVPLFAPRVRESFYGTLTEAFPALLTEEGTLAPAAGGPARVWIACEDVQPIEGEPPVFRLPTDALEAALAEERRARPAGVPVDPDAEALAARIAGRVRPRLVQSVTRILPTDDGPRPFTAPPTGLGPEEAALVGTTVHAALEHGDHADADDLARRARREARARMLSPLATERAARLARAAASIPAVARARASTRLLREWPFMLPLGGGALLEGIVDLAWVEDGELVVLDWKTDALPPGDAAAVNAAAAHHVPQLLSYAWALREVTGLAPRSVIVALLDAGREVERPVTPGDLDAARARILSAFAAATPAAPRLG
ncbi:MAG TPA: 3'-5' exonuclease, partial [bacterium]|nr:3'-5' exonuclease [bacterium]